MNVLVVDVGGSHVRVLVSGQTESRLGTYKGGKMLFLGFGTGLGSAMIVDCIIEPMELDHLPYKRHTYEEYVEQRGLNRWGKHEWQRHVADVVAQLIAALEPEDVVLGGGNVKQLEKLPSGFRTGDNGNAFLGGFRLWENAAEEQRSSRPTPPSKYLHHQSKGMQIWQQ